MFMTKYIYLHRMNKYMIYFLNIISEMGRNKHFCNFSNHYTIYTKLQEFL